MLKLAWAKYLHLGVLLCFLVQIMENLPALPLSLPFYPLTTSRTPKWSVFLITGLHLCGITFSSLCLWWAHNSSGWLSCLGKLSLGGNGQCNRLLKIFLNSVNLIDGYIRLVFSRVHPDSQCLCCLVPQNLWLTTENHLGALLIFTSTYGTGLFTPTGVCWFIFDPGLCDGSRGGCWRESTCCWMLHKTTSETKIFLSGHSLKKQANDLGHQQGQK